VVTVREITRKKKETRASRGPNSNEK